MVITTNGGNYHIFGGNYHIDFFDTHYFFDNHFLYVCAARQPSSPREQARRESRASAQRVRRTRRRVAQEVDRTGWKELEVSVTIVTLGEDINVTLTAPGLEKFLTEECNAGVISLERGEEEGHLHWQAVLRLQGKSAASINARVKAALRWNIVDERPSNGRIKVAKLTGRSLHTWAGMVGYCMKDQHKPHFRTYHKGISAADLNQGEREFLRYGAGPRKSRIVLTYDNFWDRAQTYFEYKCPHRSLIRCVLDLSVSMMRSGLYLPSARWMVRASSGEGMDVDKAEAMWRMCTEPSEVSADDCQKIFFKNRTARYFEDGAGSEARIVEADMPIGPDRHTIMERNIARAPVRITIIPTDEEPPVEATPTDLETMPGIWRVDTAPSPENLIYRTSVTPPPAPIVIDSSSSEDSDSAHIYDRFMPRASESGYRSLPTTPEPIPTYIPLHRGRALTEQLNVFFDDVAEEVENSEHTEYGASEDEERPSDIEFIDDSTVHHEDSRIRAMYSDPDSDDSEA